MDFVGRTTFFGDLHVDINLKVNIKESDIRARSPSRSSGSRTILIRKYALFDKRDTKKFAKKGSI